MPEDRCISPGSVIGPGASVNNGRFVAAAVRHWPGVWRESEGTMGLHILMGEEAVRRMALVTMAGGACLLLVLMMAAWWALDRGSRPE